MTRRAYYVAKNPDQPYREPFGHTQPITLWACPGCGRSFGLSAYDVFGSCPTCADDRGVFVMPKRAEGPRPFDPMLDTVDFEGQPLYPGTEVVTPDGRHGSVHSFGSDCSGQYVVVERGVFEASRDRFPASCLRRAES